VGTSLLDDLKHGNQRYIFVLEQVLFGGLLININTLLAHDFSKQDMSSKQYGKATEPWVSPCWLLSQGMTWVWITSNMGTKHMYLCWNKIYWVD
jgi:hypothetical protein